MLEKWTNNSLENISLVLGNSYHHIFTLERIKNFVKIYQQHAPTNQDAPKLWTRTQGIDIFITNAKIFNATKSHAKHRSMKDGQGNVQIVARMETLHNTPYSRIYV